MSVMAYPVVEYPELISPILREGYGYWRAKQGDRPFPARADFDPMLEIPKLARSMMLLDVLTEPLDFRYRLIGDKLRDHMGQNWVGKHWSEIEQQRAPNPIWLHHQWVVENREARFIRPNYVGPTQAVPVHRIRRAAAGQHARPRRYADAVRRFPVEGRR